MTKNRLDISDNTAISMPVRNMLAIIGAVAVGVWAYFGVLERITMLETTSKLSEKDVNAHVERIENDLKKNTEFRIMLIEDLYKSVEKIEKNLEQNMTNKVNIERLQKDVDKMLNDIEKLKDADREIKNGH